MLSYKSPLLVVRHWTPLRDRSLESPIMLAWLMGGLVSLTTRSRMVHSTRCNYASEVLSHVMKTATDTDILATGVIAAGIASKTGLEDIVTLTDIKTPADFHPTPVSHQIESPKGRHLDFFFRLPTSVSSRTGALQTLPPSMAIKGTTSPSPQATMNQHHVIQGECDVTYWIQARFRLSGRQVGYLDQKVRIAGLYPHLQASLPKGLPLTLRAKPDLLARCKTLRVPELSVSLYEPDLKVEQESQSGKRRITIPLALSMQSLLSASSNSMDTRQSFECSVEASWEINDRFSATLPVLGSSRPAISDIVQKIRTLSAAKAKIFFRPLPTYDHHDNRKAYSTKQDPYVATSQLELSFQMQSHTPPFPGII